MTSKSKIIQYLEEFQSLRLKWLIKYSVKEIKIEECERGIE